MVRPSIRTIWGKKSKGYIFKNFYETPLFVEIWGKEQKKGFHIFFIKNVIIFFMEKLWDLKKYVGKLIRTIWEYLTCPHRQKPLYKNARKQFCILKNRSNWNVLEDKWLKVEARSGPIKSFFLYISSSNGEKDLHYFSAKLNSRKMIFKALAYF